MFRSSVWGRTELTGGVGENVDKNWKYTLSHFEAELLRVVTIIDNVPIKLIDAQRQRGSLLRDRSVPLFVGVQRILDKHRHQ